MTDTAALSGGLVAPRLRRFIQAPARPAVAAPERCELCGEAIHAEHRHLLNVSERKLLCACRACSVLFDRAAAGGGHYRLVPDRRRLVEDFQLGSGLWEGLRIPVDLAFFFHSTPMDRVVAFYPGPMGPTESLLGLDAWGELLAANPVLAELEPDTEALLVNRARGANAHWLIPVDECYRLVGLIRSRWKGLGGGEELWAGIDHFFAGLRQSASVIRRDGSRAG